MRHSGWAMVWSVLVIVAAGPVFGQADAPDELRLDPAGDLDEEDPGVGPPPLVEDLPEGSASTSKRVSRSAPPRSDHGENLDAEDGQADDEGWIEVEAVPLSSRMLASGLAGVGGVLGLGAGAALVVTGGIAAMALVQAQPGLELMLSAGYLVAPLVVLAGPMIGTALFALPLSDNLADAALVVFSAPAGLFVGSHAGAVVGALVGGVGLGVYGVMAYGKDPYWGTMAGPLFALFGGMLGAPVGALAGGLLGAGGLPLASSFLLLDDEREVEAGEE